jgi:serine/threonine protein kinase
MADVIGQGSYGCVHKPSLHCRSSGEVVPDYRNKVSKTVYKEEADDEIKTYSLIHAADPEEEYHLGVPFKCALEDSDWNRRSLSKCRNNGIPLHDMRLLVMKNGGENLKTYADKVHLWPVSKENTEKCKLFLLETIRLIKGLIHFKNHNVVLNDVKPQNIVFDGKRLNFIDFGMSYTKSDMASEAKHDK